MEEAEQLCDQIVIIDHGVILKNGTLADLLGEQKNPSPEIRTELRRKTLDDLFTELTGRQLNE